jgi:hypothetical protein
MDIPVFVSIRVRGDAGKFIALSDNNFVLQPGEIKKVNVFATIPAFNHTGIYTGQAKILMTRQ